MKESPSFYASATVLRCWMYTLEWFRRADLKYSLGEYFKKGQFG